ncbi:MAG: methionine--tRNA ligase [Bacilli bacterium]
MKEKYYITTAIAYTSAKPHIGNTYEAILADTLARYKRFKGFDVYFQTGTDEHGQKIEDKANALGKSPQVYVDEIANEIKRIWDIVDVSYDAFIRTSNPKHKLVVQKIFKKLYEQGDIYKGEYSGLYCKACESFFTNSQLIDNKCPDCKGIVEETKEEAYFFKMSKYQDKLMNYIKTHPNFIIPESRKNEMINNFLKPGLQDLCVSRTSFKWGIPVDFDPNHVVYVWIDALANYITFLGYDPKNSSDMYKKYWPADIHIIGKDILRFHTIYWPIILMALNEELPKQIFGHPWLLTSNDKMSKSKGNVIYADFLVQEFGVDEVRYFVLNEIPYANDGNITYSLMIDRINSDLANILGNLVNRTISMAKKYFSNSIIKQEEDNDLDIELINKINNLDQEIDKKMNNIEVGAALEIIFNLLRSTNKYIDDTAPWALAKDINKLNRLSNVIYNLLESIRVSSLYLEAFLPRTAKEIMRQLNNNDKRNKYVNDNEYLVNDPSPIFMRIDKEAKLKEIDVKSDVK